MPDQNYTDITILLDRSGSMDHLAADLRGGINSLLDDQAKLPGKALVSISQFDNVVESICEAAPAADAPRLDKANYFPRGGTALLDALAATISKAGARFSAMPEHERPGKVVFVVFTDGLENASREATKAAVAAMIKTQTDQYAWNFTFLGANFDAIAGGASIGISAANSANYANTGASIRSASEMMSGKLGMFRSSGVSEAMSFSAADRDVLASRVAAVDPDGNRKNVGMTPIA